MRTTIFLDQGETMGGSEHFLLDFLGSLNASDYRRLRPVVFGGKLPEYQKKLPVEVAAKDFSFPSVKGGIGKKFLAVFRLLSAARRLKAQAKPYGGVQFFSNTPRTHFVVYLAKLVFRMKGRWVVMVHDFTVPSFLMKRIASRADIVIVNGIPARENTVGKIRSVDQAKLRIVENGVDFAGLPKPKAPQELKKILCLGRIDPRKGQKYFLEAADLLQERNPALQFFVVGSPFPGDSATTEYEKEIRQFAQDRALAQVHFIPQVENPYDPIADSDVVVLLSTEPETFGRVVIEALAMGKLVLGFDQTGPKEILHEYEQFLLTLHPKLPMSLRCEKNNAMSLAETLGYFADHPEVLELYTKHARGFVEKKYALTETKKRLLGLLLE